MTIYEQHNAYIRNYMRKRRGKPHLTGLECEAVKRCYTVKELSDLLLEIIVHDNLFAAILDE